jgi:hypothetical protein
MRWAANDDGRATRGIASRVGAEASLNHRVWSPNGLIAQRKTDSDRSWIRPISLAGITTYGLISSESVLHLNAKARHLVRVVYERLTLTARSATTAHIPYESRNDL